MKNIGKPCAGEPHARFDEGGQGKTCSLLYPEFQPEEIRELGRKTDERFDLVDFKIDTLNKKIDAVEKKLDAVAADLKAHRSDTCWQRK